jgi:SAM-dependent methyltransferase
VTGLLALSSRVSGFYRQAPRFSREFVRGKLLTDPATPAILRLARAAGGFGAVADLGCGRGQVGLALLASGLAQSVIGLDLDPVRIAEARSAASGWPASFTVADLSTAEVPACDTALILDVLLLMPDAAQLALVGRMAAAARQRVLIRAFDPDCGWRARIGVRMEEWGVRHRRDGSTFRPLPVRDLAAPLEAAGFATRVAPCWGWTPLPNVMLVAERGEKGLAERGNNGLAERG